MQIAHVGNSWWSPSPYSFSGSIGRPSGTSQNDLLVLVTTCRAANYDVNPPAGWSLQLDYNPASGVRTKVWVKWAGSAEPASYALSVWSADGGNAFNQPYAQAFLHSYRGVDLASPVDEVQIAASAWTPGTWVDERQATNVLFWTSYFDSDGVPASFPAGVNPRASFVGGTDRFNMLLADVAQPETGPSGTWGAPGLGSQPYAVTLTLRSENSPPNAPALTGPDGSVTLDREQSQVFRWTYSDPDPEDSQAAYDLRYRVIGAPSWTQESSTTPSSLREFPANTFAIGDYEWQVRTYDQRGLASPWSGSAFFSAAEIPKDVTITAPANGETIGTETYRVEWSTLEQDSYQIRTVADNGGVPDPATIYYDSGTVTSATARERLLTFGTNLRDEHVQLRTENDGLWSDWVSVRVSISYLAPAVPSFSLLAEPATASILVEVTNPAPVGDEPDVISNEIYLDEGSGEYRARSVPPSGTWRFWTPRPNFDYDGAVRVRALGSNGTSSST